MTLLQSKLRLVTRDEEELAEIQQKLVDLAQETRQELTGVGELYARVARSAKQLGASNEQLLTVTRAVGQAIQISGSSAVESQAGMIQLSQALASGTLRGDELRSVLEQMPRVAQAIADGLGVTVGKLRELGAEGRLTSQQVLTALISQAGRLNEEFRRLEPTVGQSLTVLTNELKLAVSELLNAAGTTSSLSRGIRDLAEAIRSARDLAKDLGETFASMGVTSERVGAFFRSLKSIPGASGLGALSGLFGEEKKKGRQRIGSRQVTPPGSFNAALLEQVDPLQEVRISVQRLSDEVPQFLRDMSESTETEVERQVRTYEELKASLQALRSEGLITPETQSARLQEGLDELLPEFDLGEIRSLYKKVKKETTELGEFMKGVWQGVGRSIQATLSDAIYEWDFSLKSLVDITRRAMADVLSAIITSGIKDAFLKQFSGGGGGSSGTNWLSLFTGFLGFAAGGGRVDRPTIVGEDGTELVLPPARVMNKRQMAFAGGGGVVFSPVNNFTIIEREDPEQTRREMFEYVEFRTAQQQAEFVRTLQRSGVEVKG